MKKIYLCGPTLYSNIHIGNARSLVFFDVVSEYYRRTEGVKYARNITDVVDKILALCGDKSPHDWVTENTLEQFRRDELSLGNKRPDFEPRASEYISDMVSIIEKSSEYITHDDTGSYFNPAMIKTYGSLSNRTTSSKFAVWKKSEFGWNTKFGTGRPGWHTECVAMVLAIFGGPVDIHGGGVDLKFPHHENENCQCYAVTGKPIAKKWMHVGQVMVGGKKMAKSAGNQMLVSDLAKDWSASTLRTALLMTSFSKPIDMTIKRLREAEKVSSRNPCAAWDTSKEWSDDAMAKLANGFATRY